MQFRNLENTLAELFFIFKMKIISNRKEYNLPQYM